MCFDNDKGGISGHTIRPEHAEDYGFRPGRSVHQAVAQAQRPVPTLWANCVNQGRIDDLIALYDEGATVMPTFSPSAVRNREELRSYFMRLSSREGLHVKLHEMTFDCLWTGEQSYVINGIYDFKFNVDGTLRTFPSRFTFVIDLGKESPILHHHSSQVPQHLT